MKKVFIIPLLFLSFGIASCKKEVVQPKSPAQQANIDGKFVVIDPGTIVFPTCGNWGITTFSINRTDQTADYKLLNFIFCPDNTVTISNDILSFTGNWYFMLDKGKPNYLTLDFSSYQQPPGFIWIELAGTWKIEKFGQNLISLQNGVGEKLLVIERRGKS